LDGSITFYAVSRIFPTYTGWCGFLNVMMDFLILF
jgi:hypothetical protein